MISMYWAVRDVHVFGSIITLQLNPGNIFIMILGMKGEFIL